ncbi:MAG: hypothetical protein AAB673_03015 [Patescibacteria group bacterium]
MRKILILAAIFALFCSQEVRAVEFTPKERQSLELIQKVKAFAPTLNLGPTKNFEKFEEGGKKYNFLYYHLKENIPFSYLDTTMKFAKCPYDNLADNWLCLVINGVNTDDYDVFLYPAIAAAGGTIITRRLLDADSMYLASAVIHEDFHDNIHLPRHMDEAAATLVGIVGAGLSFGLGEARTRQIINNELDDSNDVIYCHQRLVDLAQLYASGKINFQSYESEKRRLGTLFRFDRPNAAKVAFLHSYRYYFPLMCRLFYALNGDLARFVQVMKQAPALPPSLNAPVPETGETREITGFELHRYFETNILEPYFEAMIKNQPAK